MASRFDDAAMFHYVNHVGAHCNRQSMRNNESRPVSREATEFFEPLDLSPRVHHARRRVEDDYLRLSEIGPGEGNPLPFACAKVCSIRKPFTQHRFIAFR